MTKQNKPWQDIADAAGILRAHKQMELADRLQKYAEALAQPEQEPVAYSKEQMQIYADANYEAGYKAGQLAGIKMTLDEWQKSEPPILMAQPEQEPVAWRWLSSKTWKQWSLSDDKKLVAEAVEWLGEEKVQPLYTTTPTQCNCSQRQCNAVFMKHIKPLTFEQVEDCFPDGYSTEDNGILVSAQWLHDYARAVESAHGIKD